MDCKIVVKDAFLVVGKSFRTGTVDGENNRNIAGIWNDSNQNGLTEELAQRSGNLGLIGVCMDFDVGLGQLTYVIGTEKNMVDFPKDWDEVQIPSATWAVFPVHGAMPNAMPKVWERIFSEWFPSTGYEHSGGPELEVYSSDADPYSNEYYSEIWIPVKN